MKYFIITIDTEGDNLWEYGFGEIITTKNARFIPRFQDLCRKYNFKPVYLINYEMINDRFLVEYLTNELKTGNCEIGIHPHAWNNPPIYDLPYNSASYGLPYLIEYPEKIMREKFHHLLSILQSSFNTGIFSHRSGRWAMNEIYYTILSENNIKVDCSVTPHISWENSCGFTRKSVGTNYKNYPEIPYMIDTNLMEIPVSIRPLHIHYNKKTGIYTYLSAIKRYFKKTVLWFRPNGNNLHDMLTLLNFIRKSDSDYIMFMLHSSELMPGGSPTFTTEKLIEILYEHLVVLFEEISKYFTGMTLIEYYNQKNAAASRSGI